MRDNHLLMLCLMSLLLTQCSRVSDLVVGRQVAQNFKKQVKVAREMNYLLYLPVEYRTNRSSWPLLVFLHGMGERGNDLERVKVHGPPRLIEQGHSFPFIVVSPQCPDNQRWDVQVLDALLDDVVKKYRVDKNRIYLTGLSMGGFGSWAWALDHPERFAAVAPVCGGGDTSRVCLLKNTAVWVFHGAQDKVVPLERSREMVESLQKCGGKVKLTVYPEADHDAWTETYANPELYQWFLEQSRKRD